MNEERYRKRKKYYEGDYEGDYLNGVPHGKGTITYINGDKLEGEFRYGRPHVIHLTTMDGIFYYPEEETKKGQNENE